jgi:hypothetical protein
MFFLPGWAIALVTFPGVIVHETAHRFFCDLTGTPVYEVRYFRPGKSISGYVQHGPPRHLGKSLLIAIGPLLIGTVLCALLTFPAAYQAAVLDAGLGGPVDVALAWIGFSIGMHAIPSNQDVRGFAAEVHAARGRGPTYVVARALAFVIGIANALRVIWFDAIYAAAVSVALPLALAA